MNFSLFALPVSAFSTKSRIFATVDSPNVPDVRMCRTPVRFRLPLITVSPSETSRGRLSPVNAAVSRVVLPEIIFPSNGIFSPGFTTMILPTGTSDGDTRVRFPSFSILA